MVSRLQNLKTSIGASDLIWRVCAGEMRFFEKHTSALLPRSQNATQETPGEWPQNWLLFAHWAETRPILMPVHLRFCGPVIIGFTGIRQKNNLHIVFMSEVNPVEKMV